MSQPTGSADNRQNRRLVTLEPLGGGREVGRSCLLATIDSKKVLLDAGVHTAYHDQRAFPRLERLGPAPLPTDALDAVVITHFHLDHLGALPRLTETLGYRGPVYMTAPTRAIGRTLLADYRWVMTDRKGVDATHLYSEDDVDACLRRVTVVGLGETVRVAGGDLELTTYYAGHVLGAVMVRVAAGGASLVYSGDFNASPNEVLGRASIPRLRPDLLVCEATYANSERAGDRSAERRFLQLVREATARGAKVLIPVMAFGAAQEMQLLIDDVCARHGADCPVYFSPGLVAKANLFHRLFSSWMGGAAADGADAAAVPRRAPFRFSHVRPFERDALHKPGPCVLFATPHVLTAGLALEAFRAWAGDEKNLVLLPTACAPSTVGHRLLAGKRELRLPGDPADSAPFQVRCRVETVTFTAHADRKGLEWLIRQLAPRAVALVHGNEDKMLHFRPRIVRLFGVPAYTPDNGERVEIAFERNFPVLVSPGVVAGATSVAESSFARAGLAGGLVGGGRLRVGAGEDAGYGSETGGGADGDEENDATAATTTAGAEEEDGDLTQGDAEGAAKRRRVYAEDGAAAVAAALGVDRGADAETRCVAGVLLVVPEEAAAESMGPAADASTRAWLVTPGEAAEVIGTSAHTLQCTSAIQLPLLPAASADGYVAALREELQRALTPSTSSLLEWGDDHGRVCGNDKLVLRVAAAAPAGGAPTWSGTLSWQAGFRRVAEEVAGALARLRKRLRKEARASLEAAR